MHKICLPISIEINRQIIQNLNYGEYKQQQLIDAKD